MSMTRFLCDALGLSGLVLTLAIWGLLAKALGW